MRFRDIPRPFVCCVLIDDPAPAGVVRTIKLAEYEGADAFDLELQGLAPEHRDARALRPVFHATTRPIFTVYRRHAQVDGARVRTEPDDEARMRRQLDLLGSIGFDMELDTFDEQPAPPFHSPEGLRRAYDRSTPPREVSADPRAVERQRRLIEEAHRRGGDVLASTHAMTRLTPEGALRIGRLAEERGADALKLVQLCTSYEDVAESLTSTVRLRRGLSIPFVMMAQGEYGRLTRFMSPMLGSMLVFARQSGSPGDFLDQPPVRAMRAVLDNADFRISRRAEAFLPPELRADGSDDVLLAGTPEARRGGRIRPVVASDA